MGAAGFSNVSKATLGVYRPEAPPVAEDPVDVGTRGVPRDIADMEPVAGVGKKSASCWDFGEEVMEEEELGEWLCFRAERRAEEGGRGTWNGRSAISCAVSVSAPWHWYYFGFGERILVLVPRSMRT